MRNKVASLAAALLLCSGGASAQPRPANWPTSGGDPQRTGWEKADPRITVDAAKDLQLLWKLKLENQPKGPSPVTAPLILGNLISYRGFKELAFVGTSSEIVYAVDADLGKIFWQRHLEYSTREPQVTATSSNCPGGPTAMPTMPSARPAPGRGPGAPAAPAAAARGPFSEGPASVYALSSDGRLHRLNTSTGDDFVQPASVLPANARASALNMLDNIVYTVTGHECNDVPNAVWAIDLTGDAPKTASYALKGKEVAGNSGGVVLGSDGTVYVQTKDTLLALNAPDLKLKSSLAIAGVNTPVVFPYKGQELIVTAGQDRRLYLVDAAPGMALIQQTSPDANVVAGLSTWEDAANARWILASTNNAVSGYKVQERDGKPELVAGWVSRELNSPVPPVIANGVVFAFSMGRTQATLYALDAATGKELYSSRNLVNAPAALSGLTVANGRVYFATTDGTLYCFGIFMEH